MTELMTVQEVASVLKVSEYIATALRMAGITRRIRPYDMRHFFATEAIRSGADLKAVAEILGHANMTMILKHYQHTIREQKRVALDAITIHTEETRGNFCWK